MHAVDRTLCIAADADDLIYLPGCPHLVPRASVMAAATAMAQSPAATGGLPFGMLGGRASAAGLTWASTGAAVPGLGRLPQQLLVRMPGQLQGQLPRRQPAASAVGGIASAAARVGAVATTATHADTTACSGGLGLLQPAGQPMASAVQTARVKRRGSKGGSVDDLQQLRIPPYSSLSSMQQLWDMYDKGNAMAGTPPWRVMEEQHKSKWRATSDRQRWAEVLAVVEEARDLAVSETARTQLPTSAEQAVQLMEAERQQLKQGVNTYIKKLYKKRSDARKAAREEEEAAAAAREEEEAAGAAGAAAEQQQQGAAAG
jgi:hypothetical protein